MKKVLLHRTVPRSVVFLALCREPIYAQAGKPTDNAFIESFNGTFRDECLNTNPKAWTMCVLRRTMNRKMQDRRLQEPLDELEIAGEAVTEMSVFANIRSLLRMLSPREEEVLLLRLEALKYREIADQLGISMNSVNTLVARARKIQQATARKTPEEA